MWPIKHTTVSGSCVNAIIYWISLDVLSSDLRMQRHWKHDIFCDYSVSALLDRCNPWPHVANRNLHKPALWRLTPTALAALAAPVLIMTSFSLWCHSLQSWPRPPLQTYGHLTAFNIKRLCFVQETCMSQWNHVFCLIPLGLIAGDSHPCLARAIQRM